MAGKGTDEQHGVQQVMEKDGPEAVDTPTEIVDALAGVELLVVHFAPVSEAVLEAGVDLKAVFVARAGYENVNVEEAGRRGWRSSTSRGATPTPLPSRPSAS